MSVKVYSNLLQSLRTAATVTQNTANCISRVDLFLAFLAIALAHSSPDKRSGAPRFAMVPRYKRAKINTYADLFELLNIPPNKAMSSAARPKLLSTVSLISAWLALCT